MTDQRSRPLPIGSVISHGMLALVALLWLFPFVWMISTALKSNAEVFASPPSLVGDQIEWGNFAAAWNYVPFGRFMLNGLLVGGIGTLLVLITSSSAAYAFSRLTFRGRDRLFLAYLGTLMVPQEVIVVPMFILMKRFGWVDSYRALILPWAFTAFGTFLLRQFFMTIPREMEDAARMDGASRFRILWNIIIPMATPALAVLAVFTFINYWNSFLWPLIIVNSQEHATVPLGLNMFMGQFGSQWNYLMAASTISILPSLLLVLATQRYLVEGIALTGVGGR
jgi:multiple sugar transport system permease protein